VAKRSRRDFGNIRQRESGAWQASYSSPQGRRVSLGTYRTRGDAAAALAKVHQELASDNWISPTGRAVLLADWITRWEDCLIELRPSSRVRDLGYIARYIQPSFGHWQLGQVDHLSVQAWVTGLARRGLAPATVRTASQLLSKIMAGAVRAGLIRANPCEGVRCPRIERREMRFLNPAEVHVLAASIDNRYRALVTLGAFSGLRMGELLGLQWERVDLESGSIDVAEILTEADGHLFRGPPKTRAGRRSVPLPRVAVAALQEHFDSTEGSLGGPVFTSPEGGPVRLASWRRRYWKPAVEIARLVPLRPHDLRHTAVAMWIEAGASPKEVAARAGHASVAFSLDRYGHLYPGSEHQVNDALDAMAAAAQLAGDARGAPGPVGESTTNGQKPALTLIVGGGANKNRTCDLSIISAAL